MTEISASHNPLRTRRLEQLAFRLPTTGVPFDWEPLLERLFSAAVRGRGAVVGPHGSGKTTFLVELKRRLEDRNREVVLLYANRDDGSRIPRRWLAVLRNTPDDALVIADGYDVLNPFARWRLRRLLRPRGALIVTAHGRCALPTVLQTATSPHLLAALVNDLFDNSGAMPRPSDETLQHLYETCRGNLREVFRRLYRNASTP